MEQRIYHTSHIHCNSRTYTVTVTDSKGCTGTSPSVTTSFAGLPSITSFSPTAASPGSTVTLNGSGFNSDPSKTMCISAPQKAMSVQQPAAS
ncbi:MAG: IPT/TIG domain-containing protein [Bacteroidetes bacterium]|nr:IPT/TIG domain-containing protein [Bacteroidota bacterium]